jgi:hypothetical protein
VVRVGVHSGRGAAAAPGGRLASVLDAAASVEVRVVEFGGGHRHRCL